MKNLGVWVCVGGGGCVCVGGGGDVRGLCVLGMACAGRFWVCMYVCVGCL